MIRVGEEWVGIDHALSPIEKAAPLDVRRGGAASYIGMTDEEGRGIIGGGQQDFRSLGRQVVPKNRVRDGRRCVEGAEDASSPACTVCHDGVAAEKDFGHVGAAYAAADVGRVGRDCIVDHARGGSVCAADTSASAPFRRILQNPVALYHGRGAVAADSAASVEMGSLGRVLPDGVLEDRRGRVRAEDASAAALGAVVPEDVPGDGRRGSVVAVDAASLVLRLVSLEVVVCDNG